MKNKLIILIFIIIFLVGTLSYSLGLFSGGGAQASSLEKGLVAWYPLNGEYGTKDATPNANHGINNGATLTTGRKGEENGALNFSSSNSMIDIPFKINNSNIGALNSQYTFSFWIKLDEYGPQGQSVIFGAAYYNGIGIKTSSDGSTYTRINAYFRNIDSQYETTYKSLELNKWYNVVIILDKPNLILKLYVDGLLIGTKSITSSSFTYLENLNFKINGINAPGGNGPWSNIRGSISDAKLYNRALEEDEIKLLYDSFKPEMATSDLNKGLVGHWMLDSENGAKDLTPNGNHGTASGGVTVGGTTDRKGKTSGATSFDGVDDYIDTGIEENITEYTLSGWFFRDNTIGRYATIIGSKTDPRPAAGFELESLPSGGGSTLLWLYPSSVLKTPYSLNEWHFFTITRNASKTRLYMDNILIGEENSVNAGIIPSMLIGNWRIGSSQYFRGKMSDIRLYNRVLSDPEIKLLYDSYKPKEASIGSLNKGLVLDMPLTTKHMKSSTIVSDRTPYNNDGTVMNGAILSNEGASFDGINDIIDMGILNPDLRNENFITISAWIKRETGSSGNSGLGITHSWWWEVGMTFDSNQLSIRLRNSDGTQNINTGLDLNYDWNFVTLTYNRLNGNWEAIVNNDYTSGFGIIASGGQGNFRVGCLGSNPNNYFKGQISNIKIYNRILSEEEIKLLYEKGRS